MIQLLDGEFSTYFKSFTDFEKEVLIALSHGKTNPSSMAQEIRKPISSLPQILHRLMSHGIVEKYVEGRYRISDPVFSDWLSQRYPLMAGDQSSFDKLSLQKANNIQNCICIRLCICYR
jgi:hypothetical protein